MRRGLILAAISLILAGIVVGWASAGDALPGRGPGQPLDPRAIAQLAFEAGRDSQVRDLAGLRRWLVESVSRSDDEYLLARLVILDAMIRSKSAEGAETILPCLQRSAPERQAAVVLAVSYAGVPTLLAVLDAFDASDAGGEEEWLAVGNALAKHRAPGFAFRLLARLGAELRILADDRADPSPTWRKPTGGVAWSARPLKIPAGFPAVAVYALWPDHIQNEPLLVDGPRPIRYSRRENETEIGWGGVEGRLDREDARLEWIASLLGVRPADVGIARSTVLSVGPLSGPAFLGTVGSARRDVMQRLDLVAERLLKDGTLSKKERAAIRPRVRVVVTDRRQDTTAPLPTVPSSWTELEPPVPPPPGELASPFAPPAKEGEVPSWAKVAPEQIEAAKKAGVPVAFENSIGMRFVLIPAGTFTMGRPQAESDMDVEQELPHRVRLSTPLYLSIYETTNAQFRRYEALHDSGAYQGETLNGDLQPAGMVSHDDALGFVGWLNSQDVAHRYRLPTEAEWEYACRAGTQTSRFWGDGAQGADHWANVSNPSAKERFGWRYVVFPGEDQHAVSSQVGLFQANSWGLHDMLGNVWEWTADWFKASLEMPENNPMGPPSGPGRVLRGGAWNSPPDTVRSAYRNRDRPDHRAVTYGFRVAASLGSNPARLPTR